MSFKEQIQCVVRNLKLLIGFYCRKSCFSFCVKQKLVETTFLPVTDYGHMLYMNVSVHCLYVAYCEPTVVPVLTIVYSKVSWMSLWTHRLSCCLFTTTFWVSFLPVRLVFKQGNMGVTVSDLWMFYNLSSPKYKLNWA